MLSSPSFRLDAVHSDPERGRLGNQPHDGGPANVGELGGGLAPSGAGQQDAMWSNHIDGGKHDGEEDHNILGLDILVAL